MACLDNAVHLDGQASPHTLQLGGSDQSLYIGCLGVSLGLAVCVFPCIHSHIAAGTTTIQPSTCL